MICVMVFLCVKGRGGLFESTLVIRFPIYLSLDMLGFSQSQLRDWAGPMILMPVLEIKKSYFWQCTYYSEDGLLMFFMDYGRPRTGQHCHPCPAPWGLLLFQHHAEAALLCVIVRGRGSCSESLQWYLKVMFSSSGPQEWMCLTHQSLLI